jgi:protein-S-isoprenylcysteine O-methyltransferase Ste14
MLLASDPLTTLRFAVLGVAGLACVIFALSAAYLYPTFAAERAAERPWQIRAMALGGALLAALHIRTVVVHMVSDVWWLSAGLALYCVALTLFIWTRRTVRRHMPAPTVSFIARERLLLTGPYGVVRHPFYAAYLCAWVAGTVVTLNPWLLMGTLWLAAVFAWAATHEERVFDRTACANLYSTYRAKTGMFLPRVHIEVGRSPRGMTWSDSDPPDRSLKMRITAR